MENYIDQDLRKPKRKKFKNQDAHNFQFNSNLESLQESTAKPVISSGKHGMAVESTFALMRNKT